MHLQSEAAYSHIQQALLQLDQCQSLALEIDLGKSDAEVEQQAALLPDGQRLRDLISAKKYAKLDRMVRKTTGLRLASFDRLLPVLTANLLVASLQGKAYPEPLDYFLYQQAQERSIAIIGLEEAHSQAQLLQSISMDEQIRELLNFGRNVTAARRRLLKLSALYAQGDASRLYQSIRRSNGGQRQSVLLQRNHSLTKALIPHLHQASVFCAVGAGHLSGKYGMPALLSRAGFKVSLLPLYGK